MEDAAADNLHEYRGFDGENRRTVRRFPCECNWSGSEIHRSDEFQNELESRINSPTIKRTNAQLITRMQKFARSLTLRAVPSNFRPIAMGNPSGRKRTLNGWRTKEVNSRDTYVATLSPIYPPKPPREESLLETARTGGRGKREAGNVHW